MSCAARSACIANPQISTKLEERGRREEGNPRNLPWETALCQISSLQDECPGHHQRLSKLARRSCPQPGLWMPRVSPGREQISWEQDSKPVLLHKVAPLEHLSCTALPSGRRRHRSLSWLHAPATGSWCTRLGVLPPEEAFTREEQMKVLQKRTRNIAALGTAPALAGKLRHALGGDESPLGS